MPLQIKRLMLAFAVFIALFLIARQFLKPESFGEYGHYRGGALNENAAKVVKYVGFTSCVSCHDTIVKLKKTGLHASISCEVCHGPGYQHIKTPEKNKLLKPKGREFCGICHSKNAARSKALIHQVDLKEHNVENVCSECHNPHEPYQ